MSDLNIKSISKPTIILFVVIALAVTIGLAAAVYTMNAPASDPITFDPVPTAVPTPTPTPVPEATLSKVTLSTYNAIAGQTVTASTTVSDSTANLPVNFYASDGTFMGSANTNAAGTASLPFTVNSPWTGTLYATAQHP